MALVTRSTRRAILAALLLAIPVPAFADPAAVGAALKDEASECRYFHQVCADTKRAADISDKSTDAMKADPTRAKTDIAEAELAEELAALKKLAELRDVLRAKHAKAPKCLTECDLLRPVEAR